MSKRQPQSLALQRQIIQLLSDGQLYSGEFVAEQAGLTRAAIAKHMMALQQLGLDIYAIKGKGYRLAAPIQLLDLTKMKQLQHEGMADILLQHVTDSTNTQLLRRVQDGQRLNKGCVVVAEAQTQGRGRRGNIWFSPFGSNLYFSMYWQLEEGIQAAMGLSLVIGIAVAKLLENQYKLAVKLKWPNDIYYENQKLGGILVELAGQSHAHCDVVIGLGLNVKMPAASTEQIDQPWTDLQQHVAQTIDRNHLIAELQASLVTHLLDFSRTGFRTFVSEFNQRDQFKDQPVTLILGHQQQCGICKGVDEQGGLLLEQNGQLYSYFGGEISLRGQS